MGNGQFDERLEDDIIAMYVVVSVIAWRYLFYQIGCFDKEPHKGIQYGGLLKGMSRITDFPVDMPETAGYGIPQLYRYRYDGADLPLYGNGTSHDPVRRSYLFLEFLGDEQIYRFEILAELAHMEQVCNGQHDKVSFLDLIGFEVDYGFRRARKDVNILVRLGVGRQHGGSFHLVVVEGET